MDYLTNNHLTAYQTDISPGYYTKLLNTSLSKCPCSCMVALRAAIPNLISDIILVVRTIDLEHFKWTNLRVSKGGWKWIKENSPVWMGITLRHVSLRNHGPAEPLIHGSCVSNVLLSVWRQTLQQRAEFGTGSSKVPMKHPFWGTEEYCAGQ